MKVQTLIQSISTEEVVGPDVDVTGLAYDSRAVKPGFMFAALRGATADGHRFVREAVKKGAVCVLCEEPAEVDATVVRVANTRKALAQVARRFYGNPAADMTTVGITGTNGKTTTAHLVQSVLQAAGLPTAVVGTLGMTFGQKTWDSSLTTPESVDLMASLKSMYNDGARAVAMEVSSHALSQHRVDGIDYNVGVFTNLTQDHLDYHGSLDEYFLAKKRLFDERLKPHGKAVVNLDDERVRTLRGANTLGFSRGSAKDADVVMTNVWFDASGARIDLMAGGEPIRIRSGLLGRFNVDNVMAAVAVGLAVGIDPMMVARGIEQCKTVPGRLERVSESEQPLVLVDYAHSPDALASALATVRELCTGRVICVFGCGGDRDVKKRLPMGEAVAKGANVAIVTNDNPRTEDPEAIAKMAVAGLRMGGMKPGTIDEDGTYQVLLDREEAIVAAIRHASPNDVVLIAGKGHETYQIVGTTKQDFDDREVARRVLTGA